jgi:hypothetical protein
VDDATAKASTIAAKARGWAVLGALGVGAVCGMAGGAVFLLLYGAQLALVPALGATAAPLAIGGGILGVVAGLGWWLTRAPGKKPRPPTA